jgi:hypothetical protein
VESRKRQRRLTGVDQICAVAVCPGLTTGEISAHSPRSVAPRCRRKLSVRSDQVLEEMTAHPSIHNTFRYAHRGVLPDQIAHDLRPVYPAATEADARAWFEEFAEKWRKPYLAIKSVQVRLLRFCEQPGPALESAAGGAPPTLPAGPLAALTT